ncbi:MAG: lysophospholipid acyltransferase family protein [Candidatus Delongbacteria bacterium]
MKHRPSHYVEYLVMLMFQTLIRLMPLGLVVHSAKYIAFTVSFFYKIRYKTAYENLSLAFPSLNGSQKKRIIVRSYANILMSSFESYKYMFLSKKQKLEHLLVDRASIDLLHKVERTGKGCIVVGGHYGFFEAGGHYAVCRGIKCAYVVANQKNKLTEKLIDVPREKTGIVVIHRKNMLKLLKALKNNYFVALLSDQNAGLKQGVFVDFFEKKASTHKNPALLALKYKIPMLIVNTKRRKKDLTKHDLTFEQIEYDDILKSGSDLEGKTIKLVQRYTKALETRITEDPSQYWWIHKRYKTRPPKERNGQIKVKKI